ncbi:protein kinase [Solicola gregarius]|uniref:Protein kinase n=1 Tax=Solicola gregarius TaxID=2908642 RepID=A0AA46YNM4_9ACTN|nr:protein kinase [Solicola gregarius]UYM07631.1 protein kinase [Solicola gregarius]
MTRRGGWAVVVPEGYRVGPWRIGTPIASGCWGSVYAAERVDGEGPSIAACKFLPGNALTPAQRATVEDLASRERAFGANVRSEHLIQTYEVLDVADEDDKHLDGCTVIVMERARTSLREVLDGLTDQTPPPDAVAMLTGLAQALDDVHDAGWVHGDVSASNVLVMDDGDVRLADFGLSAELDGTHAYIPQLGSFDYTPAEWWSAPVDDRGVEARPSRDVWAFGVLAHRLLSGGHHPFPGCDPRTRATAVREYAATGDGMHLEPTLAAPWRELIATCLERDPSARGALAGTLADRVRALSDVPIEAGSAAPDRPADRLRTLRWHIAVGVAAATVAAVAAVGASALVSDPDSPPSSPPGERTARGPEPIVPAASAPGDIATDADVPARYRSVITKMAHRCADPLVTPAFVAAVLATESGFDRAKRSPQTGEYGIAMWTPAIFQVWAKAEEHPKRSVFNARDSIRALSDYLCWAGGVLENVPVNDPVYRAVAYRTSDKTVSDFGGVPPEYRAYAAEVRRHLREFAVPS